VSHLYLYYLLLVLSLLFINLLINLLRDLW
jgi:hypothetical protein